MSSNFISSAEIERQRREEIRKQQEEISLSNAFNLKLFKTIQETKERCSDLAKEYDASKKTYVETLINDKLVKEIEVLQNLKIERFDLSSHELNSNRMISELAYYIALNNYNKEYSTIKEEIEKNTIEIEEYKKINETIYSIESLILNFYDVNLDDYKDINIKKQKIISEIDCLLNLNAILIDDREYLKITRELLENSIDEFELIKYIRSYVEDKKQILKNILELSEKYYQYVALNNQYNTLTKKEDRLLEISDFNNVGEIRDRINNLMCNICIIKENEYIFDSIMKVCKMHGFNIIDNDSYNNKKIKLLHKEKNKTALKIVNNQKMYNFEILSLKNGNGENGISRDIGNSIDETMKDRIAFCNIHPELVKDLDKIFGIKLNVCRHTENPNDDPYNKIEVNEDIYEKLVETEELNEEQKAKYENM